MKYLISNYNEFKEELGRLAKIKNRKRLLLHSCCAPCSSHVLTVLAHIFEITILFDNPNIYPLEEYDKRYDELVALVNKMNLNIEVVKVDYSHQRFLDAIKGVENLGEKSIRCFNCYKLRLKKTYEYAKENYFDYFTTTLSISPYKNSDWINEIGYQLEDEDCHFLYSNYKKENGYQHSIALSKEYDLYRQDYCGCEFSKKEHEEKVTQKSLSQTPMHQA